jgi:hypothetical protein
MAKTVLKYDEQCDALYVSRGLANTINCALSADETLCIDPKGPEAVGFIYNNFSVNYPKIHKLLKDKSKASKASTVEFFDLLINDWNHYFSPLKSKKALSDFLKSERRTSGNRVSA